MNSVTVNARMDKKLKEDAEKVLKKLGLTPTAAINMLYSQIVLQQKIPMEIKLPEKERQDFNKAVIEFLKNEVPNKKDEEKRRRILSRHADIIASLDNNSEYTPEFLEAQEKWIKGEITAEQLEKIGIDSVLKK